MVFKVSKSKEGAGSRSKESASKESRSKEKGSKESKSKEKASKSKESASKSKKSKEKGSKSKEKISKSKESGSKEKGSKEVADGKLLKPKAKGKLNIFKKNKAPELGDQKKLPNQNPEDKKKKLRFWLIIAGIIAIVLILLIVGITLFFVLSKGDSNEHANVKSTNNTNTNETSTKVKKLPPVLCTTSICKKASRFLKSSAKFSVKPCDNFYEHVCGNYNQETAISSGNTMQEFQIDPLSNTRLVSEAKDKIYQIREACMKNGGSIISCLNKDAESDFRCGSFRFCGSSFFDPEMKQTKFGLFLWPSKYMEKTLSKIITAFPKIAAAVHEVAHPSANKKHFEVETARVENLFNDLIKYEPTADHIVLSHPVRGTIDWKRIADSLNPSLYQSLYDTLNMADFIEEMLKKHSKEAFLDLMYFSWFVKTAYIGRDSCDLILEELFPGAIGLFYLHEKMDLRTNDEIIEMTSNIKESLIEVIMETSWIYEMTKKMIIYKLKAIKHYIGYDDLYEDIEELDKLYRTLKYSLTDNFFQIVQDVQKWETKMMYEVITGKRKEEFTGAMLIVNAMYMSIGNFLYVSLGFFSFPSYHRKSPVYLNYGGTAFVVGHELGHSIGPKNHMKDYSGIGEMNSDPKYTLTMKRLTSCLSEYYSNRLYINGSNTLEENSADNIGLRAAFRAMKKETEKLKRDILLPGFEKKTNEQMFFYSMAANWCADKNDEDQGSEDVHAPHRARVNGALSLSEDFAKAFQCEEGTNMNPVGKCKYYGD